MINRDVLRFEKIQKVLNLRSVSDEIEMALKLKQLFDQNILRTDEHADALADYDIKIAYDILISHIVDQIYVRDIE